MFEIIIFIIIIAVIYQNTKKKNQSRQTPPFTAQPQRPASSASSRSGSTSKSVSKTGRRKEQKVSGLRRKQQTASPNRPRKEQPLENRTFIDPVKPYRPAPNAGERYENWMPVPEGKRVCRCGSCGPDNLIPKHSDPSNYSCYFCREDL